MNEVAGIILAGGKSVRYTSQTGIPKALAPIAGHPLLLHVCAALVRGGATRIIVLSGDNHNDICDALDLARSPVARGEVRIGAQGRSTSNVPLEVRRTGSELGTGGRLLSLSKEDFGDAALLSYADIVTDAPLDQLIGKRQTHGTCLSMLSVNPVMPWGVVELQDDLVSSFKEKEINNELWVNAGVFCVSSGILEYIHDEMEMLEEEPMQRMLAAEQVVALRHQGQWSGINTPKDHQIVEDGVAAGSDHWRQWGRITVCPI